jgi:hypothetical protein
MSKLTPQNDEVFIAQDSHSPKPSDLLQRTFVPTPPPKDTPKVDPGTTASAVQPAAPPAPSAGTTAPANDKSSK